MKYHREHAQVAKEFIAQLPAEYIDYLIENKDYVLQVEKPVIEACTGWGLPAKRIKEIENLSIHCRNKAHTTIIREELIKLRKKIIPDKV
jgi:hypothetical protein